MLNFKIKGLGHIQPLRISCQKENGPAEKSFGVSQERKTSKLCNKLISTIGRFSAGVAAAFYSR